MKEVFKVLAIFFAVIVLSQILDFSFFLMNQSDTYAFNIGIVVFAITLITMGYVVYIVTKIIKPKVKEEINQNKKEKLN